MMKIKIFRVSVGIGSALVLLLGPPPSFAQTPDPNHTQHHPPDSAPSKSKGPLDSLQKALEKGAPKTPKKRASKNKGASMAQAQMKQPMSGGGMMGMMGMMGQMMNQMGSSEMKMPPSSELPGFPGASHIYHIGATGFFVDHADMLNLTKEQLTSLNQTKETSIRTQSEFDRKIERAEEDLWRLTASDRPDIKAIESKIKEIESLKSEQRIKFIRDVGEAANYLTTEQRSVLLGEHSPPKEDM